MSKILMLILIFLLTLFFLPSHAEASLNPVSSYDSLPPQPTGQKITVSVTFNPSTTIPDHSYRIEIDNNNTPREELDSDPQRGTDILSLPNNKSNFTTNSGARYTGNYKIRVNDMGILGHVNESWDLSPDITIFNSQWSQVSQGCNITIPSHIQYGDTATITADVASISGISYIFYIMRQSDAAALPATGQLVHIGGIPSKLNFLNSNVFKQNVNPPSTGISYPATEINNFIALIGAETTPSSGGQVQDFMVCRVSPPFNVDRSGPTTSAIPGASINPGGISGGTGAGCTGPTCTSAAGEPCPNGQPGINTAIGCIPTDPKAFIEGFLKFSFGIAGGIAFLLMILGAFQMITSAGNPDTLNAGRQRFASAIIGLLFIILAVLLLKIVGVDLLGFGKFFGG